MKIIKVSKIHDCIIDDEDYERVSKHCWYFLNGYPSTPINKKMVLLHRFIMKAKDEDYVTYIDKNKLNNSKSNLKITNRQEVQRNRGSNKNSTCVYKGVHFDSKRSLYIASITFNKVFKNLGYFKSEIAAAYAYNKEAIILSNLYSLNKFDLSIEELEHLYITDKFQSVIRIKSEKQSIHKNIHFDKRNKKWRVIFTIKGKIYRCGYYKNEQDAYVALINAKNKILNLNNEKN